MSLHFYACGKEVSVSPEEIYEFATGRVLISSNPPNALIFCDGKNSGQFTPDTLNWLEKGRHEIILKIDRFQDLEIEIEIEIYITNNELNHIECDFFSDPKSLGSITFSSEPVGCSIFFNDSLLNQITPYTMDFLFPFNYKVKYSYPEHRSDSTIVSVRAGINTKIHMVLADTTVWVTYNLSNSRIPSSTINDIFIDNDNTIWLGTSNQGIAKFKGTNWEYITTDNSNLPSDIIHRILKNPKGEFWIGTYAGLVKINNGNIFSYTTDNSGLPHNYISDLEFDNDENIWIATQNGLAKYDGYIWKVYTKRNSAIPSNFITALGIDKENSILVATNAFGFAKFDGIEAWSILDPEAGLYDEAISCIIADQDNILWMGLIPDKKQNKFGGVAIVNSAQVNKVYFGLGSKIINNFYVDANNTKWICARDGIVLAKSKDDYKLLNIQNTLLPVNDILVVQPDKNGNMWIGTNGGGLVKYKMWNDN